MSHCYKLSPKLKLDKNILFLEDLAIFELNDDSTYMILNMMKINEKNGKFTIEELISSMHMLNEDTLVVSIKNTLNYLSKFGVLKID